MGRNSILQLNYPVDTAPNLDPKWHHQHKIAAFVFLIFWLHFDYSIYKWSRKNCLVSASNPEIKY